MLSTMKSGNPALNEKIFDSVSGKIIDVGQSMTLNGTVNKSFILLGIVSLAAMFVWNKFYSDISTGNNPAMIIAVAGGIFGFILGFVTISRPKASPYTAPLYALMEGLFIGGISASFEVKYHGIVIQAVGLTLATFFCMLAAYKTGLIKPTERFKLCVISATCGIALFYIINMVLGLFGHPLNIVHGSGTPSLLFSGFIVVIAALNLIIDFDFIESGVQKNCPKYMEWYGAFSLLVTLIWLYLEILRMLSKAEK